MQTATAQRLPRVGDRVKHHLNQRKITEANPYRNTMPPRFYMGNVVEWPKTSKGYPQGNGKSLPVRLDGMKPHEKPKFCRIESLEVVE